MLFEAMSHFVTFQPAIQKVTRCASKCVCKLKENQFYEANLSYYTK